MSNPSTLPSKPAERPSAASEARADTSVLHPPPPPSVRLTDPSTITLTTDGERQCLLVHIPGYGDYTPQQLIACLEAQAALGEARADAARLEVQVRQLQAQLDACADTAVQYHGRALAAERRVAELAARLPCLEAAAGVEVPHGT